MRALYSVYQFGFQGLNRMLVVVTLLYCTCIFAVIIFSGFSLCLIIFGCNRDLSENEDTINIENLGQSRTGQPVRQPQTKKKGHSF